MNFIARATAVVIALLCAPFAHAAYDEVRDTVVTLKRGSSNVTTAVLTAACARIIGCSMPLTEANCEAIKARLIADEGATRETGANVYQCLIAQRSIVTFRPNPPPTCGDRPGPDEQATRTCPPGTVGTWLQDRAWTLHPYPTCWVQGDWSPSAPPAGMCAPVDSDGDGVPDQADACPTVHASTPNGCPATPEPPTTGQWTGCAQEWGLCQFTGTRRVRYGAGTTWVERDVTAVDGGVQCRNSVFGDPLPGTTKRCELLNGAPEPQPEPTGTASLSWTAPTQNTDGSTLADLAGYRISYGTTPDALTQTIQVSNAGASSYIVSNLSPGTHFFAVRAYTSNGTESANSNIVSAVVQ